LTELYGQDDESLDALELDTEDENHVPLLIGSLALPHVNCALHIFEPRYRLMFRRIMASNRRRFAMCLSKRRKDENDAPFYEYGTMLEIDRIQTLPDGRSMVIAFGTHRFKVLHYKLTDGYHMADIERVDDVGREQENQLEQRQILIANSMRARQKNQQPTSPVPIARAMPLSLSMNRSTPSTMVGQRKSWAQRAHPQTQSNVAKAPWLQNHLKGLSAAREKKGPRPQISTSAPTTTNAPIKNRQEQTTDELIDDLARFVQKLLDLRKHQNGMGNWINAIGEPPVLFGPDRDRFVLVWWVINMFPLNEEEKVGLLKFRTLRERVMACMSWTDKFRDQWSFFLNKI
jgi:Lon protease-like protein